MRRRNISFDVVDAKTDARLTAIQRSIGALDGVELFKKAVVLMEALCDHAGTSSVVTVRNAEGVEIKINLRG